MKPSKETQRIFDAIELGPGGLCTADGARVGSTNTRADVWRTKGHGSNHWFDAEDFLYQQVLVRRDVSVQQDTVGIGNG